MPTTNFSRLTAGAVYELLREHHVHLLIIRSSRGGTFAALPECAVLPAGLVARAEEVSPDLAAVAMEWCGVQFTDPILAGNLVAIISAPEVRA